MGSLNGDVMVMRNGRSTSQVSVYNYPEHLNPFYEDDQHKRLRFWKISKKDNEGRRNSFSIGNLKDMWAFKSFRMKKKSSTLGINKTSESPPTMRRDYVVDNGGWNTFDHRLRSSNTSSINGDSFQRNATYRSSLQTLPTSNDRIGLNRNDGYRSTIQVTRSNPRYQAQQKQLQQQQQTTGVSQNRRSSQSSMVSTNPFESDDDENEDINSSGMKSVNGGSTTTLTSRTARKKRRAPAPPTPIHGRSNGVNPPTIRIESSYDNTQEELRIKEDIDIANLTAEIESFVKTKSNDDVEITRKDDVQTETTTTSSNTSSNNMEKIEVKQVEEKLIKETTPASKNTSPTTTSSVVAETASKEKTIPSAKTNGQVTTEIVTVTTTTKTKTTDVTKPLEKESHVAHVSTEIVTKTDESKEIKSNGAIPKKPTNNSVVSTSVDQQPQSTNTVADLCIKEINTQELPQKPIPLKRQTKPEAEVEVGHVECIHVHVESPRATPRKEHPSGVSSFKTNEHVETTETITTKTPFVLTSPPTQRRNPQPTQSEPVIKETVKLVGKTLGNERHSELTINEERINTKPEILVKPTLSPKPVTKEANGKIHGFAEIHKPMRKFTNTQNGHVRRASRDESISPPILPLQNSKEEENKINNSVPSTTNNTNGVKLEEVKIPEAKPVDTLKIVETTTSINSNGVSKSIEREETKDVKKVNFESSVTLENHNEVQRQEDEFDLLYRPKPASHMEWKRSTLAPLETNIPPEKRKSVKDIIESINRSQRLLNAAANKDFTALQTQTTTNTTSSETVSTHQTSETHSSSNLSENLKILDERQKEIERLVEEMTPTTSNATTEAEDTAGAANSPSPAPSNCNNEYTEAQKLDNNDIFQKCKVKKEVYDYRETSPISSNLDWNPVPKPKRTKPGHE
ncbi:mucin-2 isoform X2 [Calliphora vicina]|uniref:mucin-2 isoform X2 n=1 Tax=Calliphora vicina TaxID=7373 RepID=UPI00325B852C